MSLQIIESDCLRENIHMNDNILVVGRFIIGNNYEDTKKTTDFFSSLRED